ncbi:glycine zipper 2TM domain-containing protein [Salinisphaera sp. SPP-AMP-43]|uniref:glycine zipper 2TM domain-containing protein n=1 Tax=Salinisphaera sp. SPP-AMP-43 TaxID=3121288 RepID=UPI003C6E89DD
MDPIFETVPGGRYECAYAPDTRNTAVKGLTSPIAQAMLGGAAGGLIGNQFGSHSGQDIATGVGAAAGVAAGAWNARRMEDNRYQQCQQQRRTLGY